MDGKKNETMVSDCATPAACLVGFSASFCIVTAYWTVHWSSFSITFAAHHSTRWINYNAWINGTCYMPREHMDRPDESQEATGGKMCHACHAKRRWMWGSATPAMQSAAASQASRTTQSGATQCHECHACRETIVDVRLYRGLSAMSATQNEARCEFVPRLPCKVPRRHGRHGRPNQSKCWHPVP